MKANRALALTLVVLLSAVLIQGFAATPIAAVSSAQYVYDVKLKKGVSKTTFGDSFKFTGSGTMTVNDVTGEFSYSIDLSNGLTFEGEGVLHYTANNEVHAVATSGSGGISGTVIFTGVLKADGRQFKKGKLYAATPNRLGGGMDGFVFSSAKLTGKRQ